MTVILKPAQNHNPSPNWLSHVSVWLLHSYMWCLKAAWFLLITIVITPTIGVSGLASQGLN